MVLYVADGEDPQQVVNRAWRTLDAAIQTYAVDGDHARNVLREAAGDYADACEHRGSEDTREALMGLLESLQLWAYVTWARTHRAVCPGTEGYAAEVMECACIEGRWIAMHLVAGRVLYDRLADEPAWATPLPGQPADEEEDPDA